MLNKDPECSSTVEGYLHSKGIWRGKAPALLSKNGRSFDVLRGTIIEVREDGVVFDPGRESPFYDPEARLFPAADVVAAIDSYRQVLVGVLPEGHAESWGMELHLQTLEDLEAKPVRLVLKPNQRFAFCLAPGSYLVKEMRFWDRLGNVDQGVEYARLELTVRPNTSNYIGDLFMNYRRPDDALAVPVPFKILARPTGSLAAGIFGGLLGGALYAVLQEKGVTGIHAIEVRADPGFATEGKLPKSDQLLAVKRS